MTIHFASLNVGTLQEEAKRPHHHKAGGKDAEMIGGINNEAGVVIHCFRQVKKMGLHVCALQETRARKTV
eukprot:5145146-Prorocentrum_lima.AAC.1